MRTRTIPRRKKKRAEPNQERRASIVDFLFGKRFQESKKREENLNKENEKKEVSPKLKNQQQVPNETKTLSFNSFSSSTINPPVQQTQSVTRTASDHDNQAKPRHKEKSSGSEVNIQQLPILIVQDHVALPPLSVPLDPVSLKLTEKQNTKTGQKEVPHVFPFFLSMEPSRTMSLQQCCLNPSTHTNQENTVEKCGFCSKEIYTRWHEFEKCDDCEIVSYCDTFCKRSDWRHKIDCRK